MYKRQALLGKQVSYTVDGEEQTGVVTSTNLDANGATVRVGDKDVPLAVVQKVSNPAPTLPVSPVSTAT